MKKTIFIITFALIALRLSLNPIGLYYINNVLSNELVSYEGALDDLDLSLLKGEYSLIGLSLKNKAKPEPIFLKASNITIQLSMKDLFRKPSFDLFAEQLELNLTLLENEKKEELDTTLEQDNWATTLSKLIPLKLNTIEIKDSAVNILSLKTKGFENLEIKVVKLMAKDLLHPQDGASKLSHLSLNAILNNHAKLKFNGGVDFIQKPHLLKTKLSIKDFDLTTLNRLLKAYVPIDFTRGYLSIFTELEGKSNDFDGYAKIFLKKFDVISEEQKYKNAKHVAFEWLSGLANWIIKNIANERITTQFPFEYEKNAGFSIDKSKAFWDVLESDDKPMKEDFK